MEKLYIHIVVMIKLRKYDKKLVAEDGLEKIEMKKKEKKELW